MAEVSFAQLERRLQAQLERQERILAQTRQELEAVRALVRKSPELPLKGGK